MEDRKHITKDILNGARDIALKDVVGSDEWKRSKVGYLSGASAVQKTFDGTMEALSESASSLKGVAKAVFSREKAAPLPTKSQDEAERFEVAQSVYQKTDADIASFQAATYRGFMLYFMLFLGLVAFGIASFRFYTTPWPAVFDVLCRFLVVPPMLALVARWGFYNWQFRTRRLGSFKTWATSPSLWWPETPSAGPSAGGKSKRMNGAAAMMAGGLVLLAFSLPGLAHAADSTSSLANAFTTPSQDDLWMQLLERVYPSVGPLSSSTSGAVSKEAISNAFGALIGVLMGVSGLMMTWHMIAGMVATAHEGKVMGQRWHQIWAPLRVSTGATMLFPAWKGMCAAQVFAIYAAVWGGSIGNTLWAAYVTTFAKPSFDAVNLPQTVDLAQHLAQVETCYAIVNKVASKTNAASTDAQATDAATAYPTTYQVIASDPDASRSGVEGFSTAAVTPYAGQKKFIRWDYGACGAVDGSFSTTVNASDPSTQYDVDMLQAFEKLRAAAKKVGTDIAANSDPSASPVVTQDTINTEIKSLIAAKLTFDGTLATSASKLASAQSDLAANSKFADAATKSGWASAGAYYVTLSRMQNQMLEHIGQFPDVTVSDESTVPKPYVAELYGTHTDDGVTQKEGVYTTLQNSWSKGISSSATLDEGAARNANGESNSSVLKVYNWIFDKIGLTKLVINLFSITPGDGSALQHMINFGQNILNAFYVGLASVALLSSLTGGIKGAALKMAGMGGVIGGLVNFLMMMLMSLLVVGIVHAYILPMIPFIHFFFFTIGMLILTAEAVIAAPLWAFFHIRLDGQEFVDQVQRPGYMLMFNLFLRIPLAMMGLFFSIMIFEAAIWLLSITFYPAVLAATSANTSGLFGMLTMLVILSYLHYMSATRSFHLITQVPDRVARWFGQGGEQLGEEQDAKGASTFVVGEVRSTMTQNVSRGMAGMISGGGSSTSGAPRDNGTQPQSQDQGGNQSNDNPQGRGQDPGPANRNVAPSVGD